MFALDSNMSPKIYEVDYTRQRCKRLARNFNNLRRYASCRSKELRAIFCAPRSKSKEGQKQWQRQGIFGLS
jgi:hypothetical protein